MSDDYDGPVGEVVNLSKPEYIFSDKPPKWLLEVCQKHRPMASVYGGNDLMCAGHGNDGRSYMPWTPEHFARMIQKKFNESLKKILTGDDANADERSA
jgi:hypothetical protein